MTNGTCSEDGCNNPILSKSLCRAHYLQDYHGKPKGPVRQVVRENCIKCENFAVIKGLCRAHYNEEFLELGPRCVVDECDNPKHNRSGFCRYHQEKAKTATDNLVSRMYTKSSRENKGYFSGQSDNACLILECKNNAYQSGFCHRHTARQVRYNLSKEQAILFFNRTKCDACGIEAELSVDHDHSCCPGKRSCGKCVRGMLCTNCNTTLGRMKDNPSTLRLLANYLERVFEGRVALLREHGRF